MTIPDEKGRPSPFLARTNFNEQELAGLAASIRENGLLQPIAVRKKEDGYELVAGERRLRACKMAKMQTIPAILCDYADDKTAAMGLLLFFVYDLLIDRLAVVYRRRRGKKA